MAIKNFEELVKLEEKLRTLIKNYQDCKDELCKKCRNQGYFDSNWCKECRWRDKND